MPDALAVCTYTASETGGPSGYAFDGFSGDCNGSGSVTIAVGETKTCTLTYNDVAPPLGGDKDVIYNNGGCATASDWTIHVKSGSPATNNSGGGTASDW